MAYTDNVYMVMAIDTGMLKRACVRDTVMAYIVMVVQTGMLKRARVPDIVVVYMIMAYVFLTYTSMTHIVVV